MPGGMLLLGPCVMCGTLHHFNAERVPSWDGQPLCLNCVNDLNAWRSAFSAIRAPWGHPPIPQILVYRDSYELQEV